MKEILEKAIQKAIDDGYKPDGIQDVTRIKPTIRNGQVWVRWLNNDGQEVIQDIEHVIFNHDFAKALWGEELHHETFIVPKELNKRFAGTQNLDIKPIWQYRLQQMVIADDPIEYLGEHI